MDSANRECCEEWKLKLKESEEVCAVLRRNTQLIKEKIINASWCLNQFKQGQEKLKKANEEILELKKSNQLLTHQLDQERQETGCLRQQIEQILITNEPTLKELETVKEDLAKKTNLVQAKEAYVVQLEATVKEGKEARDSFDKVQKEATRLHKDLSAKEFQYKEATKKLKTKDSHITALDKQIEKLTASLETANNTILSMELELGMLKEKGIAETDEITWDSGPIESFDHGDFDNPMETSNSDVICVDKPSEVASEVTKSRNDTTLSGSGSKMNFPRISTKEPSPETSPPHKRTNLENRKRISSRVDDETSIPSSSSSSTSTVSTTSPALPPSSPAPLVDAQPVSIFQPPHPAAESSPRRRRRSDSGSVPQVPTTKKLIPPAPLQHTAAPPAETALSKSTPTPIEILDDSPTPPTLDSPITNTTSSQSPIVNQICPIPISRSLTLQNGSPTAPAPTSPFPVTSTPKNKPTELSSSTPAPVLPITQRNTPRRLEMENHSNIPENKAQDLQPIVPRKLDTQAPASKPPSHTEEDMSPKLPQPIQKATETPVQQPQLEPRPDLTHTLPAEEVQNPPTLEEPKLTFTPTKPALTETSHSQPTIQVELQPINSTSHQEPEQVKSDLDQENDLLGIEWEETTHAPEYNQVSETAVEEPAVATMQIEAEEDEIVKQSISDERMEEQSVDEEVDSTSQMENEAVSFPPISEEVKLPFTSPSSLPASNASLPQSPPIHSQSPPQSPPLESPQSIIPSPKSSPTQPPSPQPSPRSPQLPSPQPPSLPTLPPQSSPSQSSPLPPQPSPLQPSPPKSPPSQLPQTSPSPISPSQSPPSQPTTTVSRPTSPQTTSPQSPPLPTKQATNTLPTQPVNSRKRQRLDQNKKQDQVAEEFQAYEPATHPTVQPITSPQPRASISYQDLLQQQPTSPTYPQNPQKQLKQKQQKPKQKRKRVHTEEVAQPTPMDEENATSLLPQHPIISSMLIGISQSVELEPPLSPSLLPDDPVNSEWENDKAQFPDMCRRLAIVFSPPSPGLSITSLDSCEDLFVNSYSVISSNTDMVASALLKVLHECTSPSKVDIAVQLFWQIFQATAKGTEFRNFYLRRITLAILNTNTVSAVTYLCQLYALICKSFGDLDQVLLLAYEILRQAPIWKTQLLYAVAQWWPDPFIAKELKIGQPLLNSIEHIISFVYGDQTNPECNKENAAYDALRKACYWPYRENPKAVNLEGLVPVLIDVLVQSVDDPDSDARSPLPHRTTIVFKALELIGIYKGYVWTYNNLIVSQLWPLMAPTPANTRKPKLIPAAVRLVGILGRTSENEALQELRSKMTLILSAHFIDKHKLSFLAQTCAALTLVDLAKGDKNISTPCKIWFNSLPLDKRHEIAHLAGLMECIKQ